jgi:uncharacterized metal-binding protein YceD (DUF177 family)
VTPADTDAPRLADAAFRSDHMPVEGRAIAVTATAAEREAIAAFLEVSEVPHLEVNLAALTFRGGVRVSGRLKAAVVQPCVVTFVLVRQEIDEPVDRIFLPGGERSTAAPGKAEIFVDPEEDDAPDYFEGHEVDLSDLILESLALAIDPYPRAPDASLEDVLPPDDDDSLSPFASLKSLKNPTDT